MLQGSGREDWIQRAGVALLLLGSAAGIAGCKADAAATAPAPQAMPVMVAPVSLSAVPNADTYVATIKGRRSASISPQVDGNITKILVVSGQAVSAGQVLMEIDPSGRRSCSRPASRLARRMTRPSRTMPAPRRRMTPAPPGR